MNARLLPSLAVASLVLGRQRDVAAQGAAGTEERVTRSAAGPVGDHAADELRDPTSFELLRREPAEITVKPRRAADGKGAQQPQGYLRRLVGLRRDDGHLLPTATATAITATCACSSTSTRSTHPAYVYAEIYLSADGTAWEHLYSTQDFAVYGSDPDDDYEVETELVSGYSTGLYDVLIELYDADTGELVDEFGPNESSEFSLLPLEDSGRDGARRRHRRPIDRRHDGGGGAVSWLGLAGLLGALALRRRRLAA